jgi:hypothetical protein
MSVASLPACEGPLPDVQGAERRVREKEGRGMGYY